MKKILIIDDDIDMCTLLSKFLQRKGFETAVAYNGNKGLAKFSEDTFDMVLCDYRLGDKDGRDVLKQLKGINPAVIVIIITGYSDIKTAVDVIKLGAYDYISKPLIPEEVMAIIQSALSNPSKSAAAGEEKSGASNGSQQHYLNEEYLVGEHPLTRKLYEQIKLVSPTNYSVILYGESGTGKEVVAKTIHNNSDRKHMPFIAMDCGTLSKELSGSELFGHVKGAFTGALQDKEGHFELANGGTLFLDEVSNLSYDIQASLLRVIQERKFKRVGGNKEMPLDLRIIVASNENLRESYRKGKFREDLFHRFNEFSITVPPIRECHSDIKLFANFFLQKTNSELNKNIQGFSDEVLNAFMQYSWPGNLREFRNVVRRTALLCGGDTIGLETLPPEIVNNNRQELEPSSRSMAFSGIGAPNPLNLKDVALKAERETIMSLLKQVKYNKTKAAQLLDIDRKTLYNKMKNLDIDEHPEA
jgi:two-component system, NtrC family, response regulator HydG